MALAARGWRVLAGVLLPLVLTAPAHAEAGADEAEWRQWREQREKNLTAEESWTSLVGLHWLDGSQAIQVGSDPDSDIVLVNVPARLGQINHEQARWLFTPAPEVEVSVAGAASAGPVVLATDVPGVDAAISPPRVRHGSVSFTVIQRGERAALRVWDREATARVAFAGLDYFPWDRAWQLQARWQAHEPPRTLEIVDVTGHVQPLRNPGAVRFLHAGREFRLEAVQENDDDDLLIIFADRSNRSSSYGAGRYLYARPPGPDGAVTVDFNRAFNPPCAFSAYATCPLPPPENRLDLEVAAGERRYPAPG